MNAKEELQKLLARVGSAKVECWSIWTDFLCDVGEVESILKRGYTPEEFERELNQLDFEYDAGYGCQELYGTVLFTDGGWLERGEYDGSEWWEYKHAPRLEECD